MSQTKTFLKKGTLYALLTLGTMISSTSSAYAASQPLGFDEYSQQDSEAGHYQSEVSPEQFDEYWERGNDGSYTIVGEDDTIPYGDRGEYTSDSDNPKYITFTSSGSGEYIEVDDKELSEDIPFDDRETVTKLNAFRLSDKTAIVKWDAVQSADGYRVLVKKDGSSKWKYGTYDVKKGTRCRIKGLNKNKIYKIQVIPYKNSQNSITYTGKSVILDMKKQPLISDISVVKKIVLNENTTKKLSVQITKGKKRSYIASIQYQTKNTQVCTLKNGVITAKKKGIATIRTTVLLKNGTKNTYTTKVTVK